MPPAKIRSLNPKAHFSNQSTGTECCPLHLVRSKAGAPHPTQRLLRTVYAAWTSLNLASAACFSGPAPQAKQHIKASLTQQPVWLHRLICDITLITYRADSYMTSNHGQKTENDQRKVRGIELAQTCMTVRVPCKGACSESFPKTHACQAPYCLDPK